MPKMRQKCTSFFVQKRASDGQITKNILIAKCDDSMLGIKRNLRPCWLKLYVNSCVKMFSTIFTNFSIQLTQIGPKMASLSILDPKFTVHARVKPFKLGGRFCKERSCKGWILKLLKYSTLVSHNFGKRVTLREQWTQFWNDLTKIRENKVFNFGYCLLWSVDSFRP